MSGGVGAMPLSSDRSTSELVQAIADNGLDILRSELRLAKTEVKDEIAAASRPAIAVLAGLCLAAYAVGLMILTGVYLLATVVAPWKAVLIVGVGVTVTAVVLIVAGVTRLKRINVNSPKTIASLKETMQWASKPTK